MDMKDMKPVETRTNLIVNYLPQTMTQKELLSVFSTIGPVKEAKVMMDLKTGYSYGFGFVDYQRTEDAVRAIQTLNGLEVQNKRLKVAFARPPGTSKDTNLYCANLPRNWTETDVDRLFSPYGLIVQRNLLRDKTTGMMRGVAFVRFESRAESMAAIAGLHGKIPEGCTDPLTVKVAEEHGKSRGVQPGMQAGGGAAPGLAGPRPPNMYNRAGGPMRSTGRYNAMGMAGTTSGIPQPMYQYRPY